MFTVWHQEEGADAALVPVRAVVSMDTPATFNVPLFDLLIRSGRKKPPPLRKREKNIHLVLVAFENSHAAAAFQIPFSYRPDLGCAENVLLVRQQKHSRDARRVAIVPGKESDESSLFPIPFFDSPVYTSGKETARGGQQEERSDRIVVPVKSV